MHLSQGAQIYKRPPRKQAGRAMMLVGLAGLEPATFRPPDGRATRLRHSPTEAVFTAIHRQSKQNTKTDHHG